MRPLALSIAACITFGLGLTVWGQTPPERVSGYVRPEIGTSGHGHTYPGATLPHGLVQVSPDTYDRGWDWCSGYHRSDNSIMGFSHTHFSGTGCPDLGDILLMPTVGPAKWEPGSREHPEEGYRSRFDHAGETMSAGYYKVRLKDTGVEAELTATERVGIHRYTFPATAAASILIDLAHGIESKPTEGDIKIEGDRLITGWRRSDGWVNNKTYYFAAEFSKPITLSEIQGDDMEKPPTNAEIRGKRVKARLEFAAGGEPIMVKVALSPTGVEGAKANLRAEAPDWDFNAYHQRAEQAWEDTLGRIRVEGGDRATKETFYTALYHTLCAPVMFCDADGSYVGEDRKRHDKPGFKFYSTFSLWDTFRAAQPLMTILEPERVSDMVDSMLAHYDQSSSHTLPVWTESGGENWCMLGYHSIPVIVDAFGKGLAKADPKRALEAMHTTLSNPREGRADYDKIGYVPAKDAQGGTVGSVSLTVEYAYDDAAVARLATKLGNKEYAEWHGKRAENYANLFNPEIGFIQPRNRDGSWMKGFDPRRVDLANYVEGNGWHYGFFAPQDLPGLIQKIGGREKFVEKLDQLFTDESRVAGDRSDDASGLIGQDAHGNEPSHHAAYLYDYAGAPWKTQKWAREIMARLYSNQPDGLCGNEDCGQMSAWYALSAMGFYEVDPSSGRYALGSPLFNKVSIAQPGGKTFTVVARNNSAENKYVQKATLNGQPWDKAWFTHADIQNGATLELEMGPQPNEGWAVAPEL